MAAKYFIKSIYLSIYLKESVNAPPKVVGFLQVLPFPSTGNDDKGGWDQPLTDPSTEAVPRDQTRVIIKVAARGALRTPSTRSVQLCPSQFRFTLHNSALPSAASKGRFLLGRIFQAERKFS